MQVSDIMDTHDMSVDCERFTAEYTVATFTKAEHGDCVDDVVHASDAYMKNKGFHVAWACICGEYSFVVYRCVTPK